MDLTPERLDAILIGRPEKLWGAPAIAQALGVSVATVYRFALETDCPVYRPGGRYFAYRSELENWLRSASSGETVPRASQIEGVRPA